MNARTSRSLLASVSVNSASWVTVANRSPLPSPKVSAACGQVAEHLVAELRPARRAPSRRRLEQVVERAVLVDAVGAERLGQVAQAGVDPVELDRDGGVGQRDVGAVGHHRALPSYAGVSWTNRSATSVGVTITALASAGSLYFASYSISTRTELPSGVDRGDPADVDAEDRARRCPGRR